MTCLVCGKTSRGLLSECPVCTEDKRRADQIKTSCAAMLADLPGWVLRQMKRCGFAPREYPAVMSKIPADIKNALPSKSLRKFLSGEIPPNGFGIGGDIGGGKTMALAAMFKKFLRNRAAVRGPREGQFDIYQMKWCFWPDEVIWLRAHTTERDSVNRLERIELLKQASLLLLDDLGRERIKGCYTDDWAASQLDSIINYRYRQMLPILWTTNVSKVNLIGIYGAGMFSRLNGDNPLYWVDDLPDMRILS